MLCWDPALSGKSGNAREEKEVLFPPPRMKKAGFQIVKVMLTTHLSKPVYEGYLLLQNLKVKD